MASPDRGEIWLIDPGDAAKIRPGRILGVPVEDQDRALVTIVPHTTSPRGSSFEVSVSIRFPKAGVFDAQNLVTIPQAKLIRRLGQLLGDDLIAVEDMVQTWLDL